MVIQRNDIEKALVQAFPGKFHHLDASTIPFINQHKDGNYGFSYLGLRTSCRPEDPQLPSQAFPLGLLYKSDKAIFGVRIAQYQPSPDKLAIVLISPRGSDWVNEVQNLQNDLKDLFPDLLFFIRHLNEKDRQALGVRRNLDYFISGDHDQWLGMDFTPWQQKTVKGVAVPFSYIVADDQEFSHRLLNKADIVSEYDGNITTSSHKRGKRTRKFFADNQLELQWGPLNDQTRATANALVDSHFKDEVSRSFYQNVTKLHEAEIKASGGVCKIASLVRANGDKLPIGLFAVEDIKGDGTAFAMYAGFSNNDIKYVGRIAAEPKHVEEIHRYIIWSFLNEVAKEYPQVKQFDLGGSEIKSLDDFKRDIGCKHMETYWASSLKTVRDSSIVKDLVKGS